MISLLLLAAAISNTHFSPSFEGLLQAKKAELQYRLEEMKIFLTMPSSYPKVPANPVSEISQMLYQQSDSLNTAVINKVLTILQCAYQNHVGNQNILSIIDYSKPSNEKRLWIFSLKDKKLLFHTYVSHGIKSGTFLSQYFSNKNNSKASSIGVYRTDQTYYGRDGLSLRFTGLDPEFNSNASQRYIVMHGGWYVSEDFIKKYGRPGRSWGCPAVPEVEKTAIINTIKDNSLFVAYYPHEDWFAKSKFLHCNEVSSSQNGNFPVSAKSLIQENEQREEVLFAHVANKKDRENNEAILVMPAERYEQIFHAKAPLGRMLRRQIADKEYIALSKEEFKNVVNSQNGNTMAPFKEALDAIYFVVPVIKMVRGYYETQMQIVDTGKIIHAQMYDDKASQSVLSVKTENNRLLPLRGNKQFIRWLGL